MSRLLSEIKQQDEAAAAVLEALVQIEECLPNTTPVVAEAGLLTDSDIQSLTREKLNELFPGSEKFQLRRTIFKIIHKQKPVDQVLKELKGFILRESFRDALTNNGVLVDYLPILKDMKTQMNHVQSFLDAHICLLEGFSTNQPNQQSDTCGPDPESHNGQPDGLQQGAPGEVMSRLLSQIKQQDEAAAAVLERAGLSTDSDIQMLTIEDLCELFPGHENIKLRETIFEIIHKQKPVDQVLKELKGFIPRDSFRAALTNNGVLVDYRPILKDMKTQMNHVQSFFDAHDSLLEEFSTNQPNQQSATCGPDPESHYGQPDGRQQGAPGTSTSATDGPEESHNCQTDGGPQGAPDSLPGGGTSDASGEMKPNTGQTGGDTRGSWYNPFGKQPGKQQQSSGTSTSATDELMEPEAGPQRALAKLKYRMVVSGKTFDAHLNLMQRVKDQVQNQLQLDGSSQDHEITFVFCPICSRVASDVEAAMTDVKVSSDDKPVILVLMHHTREVKYTSSLKTWHDNNNVVLFINVFYHETIKGLLNCEENNAAVSKIQNELVERFLPGSIDSRGNPQGMGAGGLTGDTSGRGGGNDRGSGVDSRSSGRGMFQSMCDYISSKK
ncbi:uncharacterized protein si:ch211-245h14.1 isoform X14 [Sebastes umbrosus]|uniref:uncharacterized protein si:ch211-245h14.1 isoform X14 n=1 Tax=Sebastes umbrosus TaxID=72105 RepID=UPI00189F20B4|nr:uncharacterized protein si:ch211-245h14.1 isoform X14 [Sebastes umbrosus]